MTLPHARPDRPAALGHWPGPRHVPSPPPPDLVAELQRATGHPALSVLLPTTPAAAMGEPDRAGLRGLLDTARRRLRADGLAEADELADAMDELAQESAGEPTAWGLALFATTDGIQVSVRLPVPVVARVVVDPTFATRDLGRAMHRTPSHAVLVLGSREARLLYGAGDQLHPAGGGRFPMHAARDRRRDPARPGLARADAAAFWRDVDAALGAHLRLHPSPLVLAGSARTVAGFTAVSRHLDRLAGTVEADLVRESPPVLAARARPVLERYLHSRQDEALALLAARIASDQAVSGLAAAWFAARHERPEMLVVDDSLVVPARLSPNGDLVEPADDPAAPDVIDDLVDELIELVLRRGGWIALARPGALTEHDGIALTLRSRSGR